MSNPDSLESFFLERTRGQVQDHGLHGVAIARALAAGLMWDQIIAMHGGREELIQAAGEHAVLGFELATRVAEEIRS